MTMKIVELEWCTPEYQAALELRHEVLRAPLGLKLTPEELDGEHSQIHFGAYDNDELIGTVVLRFGSDGVAQIRQMAVRANRQKTGVGTQLLQACEDKLRHLGFQLAYLHARSHSTAFYQKHGYTPEGDPFETIGLAHQKMVKRLSS